MQVNYWTEKETNMMWVTNPLPWPQWHLVNVQDTSCVLCTALCIVCFVMCTLLCILYCTALHCSVP